jgi:1-deoxy-D-xylulose-5-phosphate synthase
MSTLTNAFPLLSQINSPDDLRLLPEEKLPLLATELRHYLVDRLDQCGGHFGANLGTVELTIAIHYVYHTPKDRLVWDVGHQAYPHKILTGRRDQIHTVKQQDGLAPFPKRDESEYDAFGTGHSSTSIGAALGMAVAAKLDAINRKVIAVIGDGGLTGGQAFEALNHGGDIDPNMLVILNDNDMSISENVGALSQYLGRILSGKTYATFREGSKKILAKMPPVSRLAKKTETHLKGMLVPGTLFEELGFNYIGPIDGHDLPALVKTLQTLKTLQGPKFLHVITTKGKGYAPAEAAQIDYHAVKPGFHSKSNQPSTSNAPKKLTYSDVFGNWLCDMASTDEKLLGITPAMREGSGMVTYAKQFPDRYFDVGIAEQHALTFAAGLACEGKKPVVAIYSTFLQRAYDQLIHDIALQNLDVTFAIDRAGLVGSDGPTHAGSFDLSYLRCIPNMIVMTPTNENECRHMLTTAYQYPGPAAVRYPRGTGPGVTIESALTAIPIGKAITARQGKRIALLVFGSLLTPALQAAEAMNATVINMRFVKPLDEACLLSAAKTHELLVTIEENAIMGGAGSAVSECLSSHRLHPKILHLGLPDAFLEHGDPEKQLSDCGLDAKGIVKSIQCYLTPQESCATV